jgi:hypothetical protein
MATRGTFLAGQTCRRHPIIALYESLRAQLLAAGISIFHSVGN